VVGDVAGRVAVTGAAQEGHLAGAWVSAVVVMPAVMLEDWVAISIFFRE